MEKALKRRELTSARGARAKLVKRLRFRRHREKEGLFVAEGPHLAEAALAAGAKVREVLCTEGFIERHGELAARLEGAAWPVWVVAEDLMGELAATEHSQGVLCVAELLADAGEPAVGAGLLALALEGVGDPGNVGSALRAAHAAGASVILGPGCCDRFNAKAARASAGGVFAVPTTVTEDLAGMLRRLRGAGARVVAADARSERMAWEVDLAAPTVLVVGSEARGVSDAARAEADETAAIPMPGGAESLNAGAAVSVLLYEAVRQRGGQKTVDSGQ